MVVHHNLLKPFFPDPSVWAAILRQRFRQGLSREINFDEIIDLTPFWENTLKATGSLESESEQNSQNSPTKENDLSCARRLI